MGYVAVRIFCRNVCRSIERYLRRRGTLLRTVRKTTKWIEREEDLTIL